MSGVYVVYATNASGFAHEVPDDPGAPGAYIGRRAAYAAARELIAGGEMGAIVVRAGAIVKHFGKRPKLRGGDS
jgi:hypothetical protein